MAYRRTSILLAPALALAAGLALTSTSAHAEGSRWVAAIPFGAGQFHNGDTGLGVFFAVSQAAFAGASLATVAAVDYLAREAPDVAVSRAKKNEAIRDVTAVNRISFTVWATLAAAGVIEAQLSFARKHPKQEGPRLATAIVPVAGGAMVCVGGEL